MYELIIIGLVGVVIGMLLYRKHKDRINDVARKVKEQASKL